MLFNNNIKYVDKIAIADDYHKLSKQARAGGC
jgi:hypothetical protein